MKLRLIIWAMLITILTGCGNIQQSNIEPTPVPETTVNYSSYTGDWLCKDKSTGMHIEVDDNGNVKGCITTVVGTHVPGSSITGVIKDGILTAKLKVDDYYPGTLTLSFNDPIVLEGNVKLDNAKEAYWKLAEGDMKFVRYE